MAKWIFSRKIDKGDKGISVPNVQWRSGYYSAEVDSPVFPRAYSGELEKYSGELEKYSGEPSTRQRVQWRTELVQWRTGVVQWRTEPVVTSTVAKWNLGC